MWHRRAALSHCSVAGWPPNSTHYLKPSPWETPDEPQRVQGRGVRVLSFTHILASFPRESCASRALGLGVHVALVL